MEGHVRSTPSLETQTPWAIVALGTGLFLAQPTSQVLLNGTAVLVEPAALLGTGLAALFTFPVVYGGFWLRRSGVGVDRYPRVAAWCAVITLGFLAVNLVIMAAWPGDTLAVNVGWAVNAASMGAAGGVLFGAIEARAIERAREAERESVRSEQLETQREWLEYLNSLLRHEVLNTANVITGYTEMLIEDHRGDELTRDRLERIARQSRKMTDVIQDIRLLIQATNEDLEFETVDVVSVLSDEVTAVLDRHEDATVETSWPDSAGVSADDLVARVFSNLLENAVVHNDADVPRVEVDVRTDPETVTVTVADNGPGVPQEERETLFERSGRGDHGLGLYLVRTLLARYGGTIELVETGPDGSTFAVELPRASMEPTVAEERRVAMADAV